MKVLLSERVEADIARQFEYGFQRFGHAVAARTFARIDTFLFKFLPTHPRAGHFHNQLGVYETWIARTPFVIFFRVDDSAQEITVLALFHHAQDRDSFEPD